MRRLIFGITLLMVSTAVKAQEITLSSPDDNKPDTAKIFVAVENKPSFQGGMQNFYSYVSQNLQYPPIAIKNHTEGYVFLTFIIEKDGSLSNVKAISSVSEEIDAEAIRVVENSPKWNPGVQNGRPVRVQYKVPITFILPAPDDPNKVFTAVEIDPMFPGGIEALHKYLVENVNYPASAVRNNTQGKVFLTFVVEKDGSLTMIKVRKSVSEDLDVEAVRVMKICPKWNPGMQNGRPVRVQYTLPIAFTL